MEKDSSSDDVLDLEWLSNFEQLEINQNPQLQELFEYRDREIFRQDILKSSSQMQKLPSKSPQKLLLLPFKPQTVTQTQEGQRNKKQIKAQHIQSDHPRNPKDFLYSRAYRQRRRQKYKTLQQENVYLKKRIGELQAQLREQEIELSRCRYQPPEKEVTIQELDRDFISGTMSYVDKVRSDPVEERKQVYTPNDCYYQGFIDSYNERGFAGRKKVKILNYHFNELLQALLRDSEKYLSLVFVNSESYDQLMPLPQFQTINNAYMDVYKSQGDLWHRLKEFNQFLKPMTLELNTLISQFYKKFEEILSCCQKFHNFLRETYLRNMDVAFRRVEMQKWFDFNKYGKIMRKLRNKWFQWMETLAGKQEQQTTKHVKRGSKKKKISSQTSQ